MAEKDDVIKRIREEEDYIRCPKASNSLTKFLSKNPEGVEDPAIARVLMLSEEEVQKIYGESVDILRDGMEEDED